MSYLVHPIAYIHVKMTKNFHLCNKITISNSQIPRPITLKDSFCQIFLYIFSLRDIHYRELNP